MTANKVSRGDTKYPLLEQSSRGCCIDEVDYSMWNRDCHRGRCHY